MNELLWVVFCKGAGQKRWSVFESCSSFKYAFNMLTDAAEAKDARRFKMVQYMPVPEVSKPLLRKVVAKARTIAKAKAKAKR